MSSLLPKNKRSLLRQFRCGVSTLETEIPSGERYCIFCDENAIEDEINFLCTCTFYSEFRNALFLNINLIEPSVVNISAMSGIDLITFMMNDKFVKYVADFISNAWYKRQHALFNWTHITLFCFIFLLLLLLFLNLYCTFLYIICIVTNKSSRAGYFV